MMPKNSLSLLFASLSLLLSLSYSPLLAGAQTTAEIFVPHDLIPSGLGTFQGKIVGTGADGTTFVVSNMPTNTDVPSVTATIVEDASQLSLVGAFTVTGTGATTTATAAVSLGIQCGFSNPGGTGTVLPATCTVEESESSGSFVTAGTTTLSSETVQLVSIVVSTAA